MVLTEHRRNDALAQHGPDDRADRKAAVLMHG